ncbi:hypothetical protein ACWEKP_30110, partial [Streptomyces phaeochromogenes]
MPSPTPPTAADAMLAPEVQVSDHTGIDRALDVLRGSHTEFVLIRDDTGRCAGIVTRDQLADHGVKPWYAENTRVRDIAHDHSPFARPRMPGRGRGRPHSGARAGGPAPGGRRRRLPGPRHP